jgi:hypothetical protein
LEISILQFVSGGVRFVDRILINVRVLMLISFANKVNWRVVIYVPERILPGLCSLADSVECKESWY